MSLSEDKEALYSFFVYISLDSSTLQDLQIDFDV